MYNSIPSFLASSRKQSMMVWESLDIGKIQLSGYVFNATPRDSNQLTVSCALNCSKAFRRNFSPRGYFSESSRLLNVAFVTLHRPPPEIFTLPRNLLVFSKMQTSAAGKWDLAEMAEKKPAAPPPMMVIFKGSMTNEMQDTIQ